MKYTRIKDPKNSSHIATHEKVEKIKVTKDHNICKIEGDIIIIQDRHFRNLDITRKLYTLTQILKHCNKMTIIRVDFSSALHITRNTFFLAIIEKYS